MERGREGRFDLCIVVTLRLTYRKFRFHTLTEGGFLIKSGPLWFRVLPSDYDVESGLFLLEHS
jgi:hypothetical protein